MLNMVSVKRAIAGMGAAGLFAGNLVIITYTSPLDKRPIWQSLISGMFGIGSVVGPLVSKEVHSLCICAEIPVDGRSLHG